MMNIPRYLSLAVEKADDDAEILPGVVEGWCDVWPVPEYYDARWDVMVPDQSEHAWSALDVRIAPGMSARAAADQLRAVAAWLDAHGAELLAHPRVVEQLAKKVGGGGRGRPWQHIVARSALRIAIERINAPKTAPKTKRRKP